MAEKYNPNKKFYKDVRNSHSRLIPKIEVKIMPENKITEKIIQIIGYLGIALGTIGIIILIVRILTKS